MRACDAAQEVLLAHRLADVRERDDDALSAAHERAELVLRLRQPAGNERGPLRFEGERLTGGKRVEHARPRSSGTGSSPSSSQTVRTSSACQTRSGPAGTGGTRSVGIGIGWSSSSSVGSTRSSRRSAAG